MLKKACNTNVCTCWFDSFLSWDWTSCCKQHDDLYINRKNHTVSKSKIDKDLFTCVRGKTCWLFAAIMWSGNKLFSWYAWRRYK